VVPPGIEPGIFL